MSITETLIKVGGFVLAVIGFCFLLDAFNVTVFGIAFKQWGLIGEAIVGLGFIGLGILIVRGGRPTV